MAVKIEKGGWALIFMVGLGLVGYTLNRYDVVNFGGLLGGSKSSGGSEKVDTSQPLPNLTKDSATNAVRVRDLSLIRGMIGKYLVTASVSRAPQAFSRSA